MRLSEDGREMFEFFGLYMAAVVGGLFGIGLAVIALIKIANWVL